MAVEISSDSAASESSSSFEENSSDGNVSPITDEQVVEKKKVTKKVAKSSAQPVPAASAPSESGELSEFGISPEIISRLNVKGITHLFPIQQKVYGPITEGNHVVAKARTGSGKTLAFLLPVFQMLHTQKQADTSNPRALVLVPTRELATQITTVVDETVKSLRAVAIYGGASISAQQQSLRKGVDLVIGTPGRVKDMIDRGSLNFKCIQYVVLDEVDRMLDMGFKDAVQEILDIAKEASSTAQEIQFLFFSATITPWVDKASKRYMKSGDRKLVTIDLVGDENMKTSKDVRHLAISCMKSSQPAVINDLIRMYSTGSDAKTIIFCERKVEVDELAMSQHLASHKTHVLHGDIPQAKREKVIKGFKEGSINVLIATDVAARGLDIPKIDLVIQCSPPSDLESYVHRSGRTGRAGKKGIAICIHSPRAGHGLARVEQFAKFKFERISPPSNLEIINSLAKETVKQLDEVQPSMSDIVLKQLKSTLSSMSADELRTMLAKAICVASGCTKESSQSLLNKSKGCTTLIMSIPRAANSQGLFFVKLRDQINSDDVSKVTSFALSEDKKSFVFDVEESNVEKFLAQWIDSDDATLKVAKSPLPKLLQNNTQNESNGGRYFGQSRGGSGNFNRGNGGQFGKRDFGRNNGNSDRGGRPNFQRQNSSFKKSNFGGNQGGSAPKRTKF